MSFFFFQAEDGIRDDLVTGVQTCALPIAAVAASAAFLSLAQRRLSTRVRSIRRRAAGVAGEVRYRDGSRETIDARSLIAAPEAGLRLLWPGIALLAIGLLLSPWL